MHTRRGNLIPAVIVILAISALIAVYAFSIWPKSDEFKVSVPVIKTKATNAGSNISTGNANTNTTAETLPAGVKRFTSDDLGITFTYLATGKDYTTTVQEIGDKVYVAQNLRANESITTGQWVEVISKDTNDTLAQAIEKKFLVNYDSKKCFVKATVSTGYPSTYSTARISFPYANNNVDPWFAPGENCPPNYTETNGENYFMMDSAHPDRFLFFSIGQYGIWGSNDQKTTWQGTLRVTHTNPTAGWKTYTNTVNHYSIQYPPNYTQQVNGGTIEFEKNGSPQQSALQAVNIIVFSETDQNINSNEDLYTWAKNGFSRTASLVAYHNNPREVTLGANTFIQTDGDQGSSGIPEYFIFHNNVLYELTDLHGDIVGSENPSIISTFTFTK